MICIPNAIHFLYIFQIVQITLHQKKNDFKIVSCFTFITYINFKFKYQIMHHQKKSLTHQYPRTQHVSEIVHCAMRVGTNRQSTVWRSSLS